MARKMKDSGIEWIGEIPEKWEVSQLKYAIRWKSEKGCPDAPVLSLYRDFGVVPKDSRDDNHNVTSLDTSNYKVVDIGDLVINKMKAWQGSMAVSDYRGIVSPAYHVCSITSNKVNKRYLHHLLRNPAYLPEYVRLSTGMRIGQWDLGFDDFKNIPFLIPPLDEQAKIADYLDNGCASLDAILDKTRSSIEEYKKLKQSVITQAVTKTIYDDFRNPSKFRKLRSLCDVLSKGTTPKDIETQNDEFYCIRYLKSENIVSNQLNLNPTFFITAETNNSLERSKLNSGDILFVIAGASIGKVAITTSDFLPANTNQAVAFIRLSSSYQYATKYIWYFLQSDVVKQLIALSAVQSAQPNLSLEDLGAMRLPLPDQMGCLKITDYLDAKCAKIDRLIAKKEQLVKELESYKKSLIYEVVTGKEGGVNYGYNLIPP